MQVLGIENVTELSYIPKRRDVLTGVKFLAAFFLENACPLKKHLCGPSVMELTVLELVDSKEEEPIYVSNDYLLLSLVTVVA
jgi:hypothetical protein